MGAALQVVLVGAPRGQNGWKHPQRGHTRPGERLSKRPAMREVREETRTSRRRSGGLGEHHLQVLDHVEPGTQDRPLLPARISQREHGRTTTGRTISSRGSPKRRGRDRMTFASEDHDRRARHRTNSRFASPRAATPTANCRGWEQAPRARLRTKPPEPPRAPRNAALPRLAGVPT
jgi:hypothetical protein